MSLELKPANPRVSSLFDFDFDADHRCHYCNVLYRSRQFGFGAISYREVHSDRSTKSSRRERIRWASGSGFELIFILGIKLSCAPELIVCELGISPQPLSPIGPLRLGKQPQNYRYRIGSFCAPYKRRQSVTSVPHYNLIGPPTMQIRNKQKPQSLSIRIESEKKWPRKFDAEVK